MYSVATVTKDEVCAAILQKYKPELTDRLVGHVDFLMRAVGQCKDRTDTVSKQDAKETVSVIIDSMAARGHQGFKEFLGILKQLGLDDIRKKIETDMERAWKECKNTKKSGGFDLLRSIKRGWTGKKRP